MGGARIGVDGGVGVCRIESPETQNALSPALMTSIADGLATLDADSAVHCIVLAGTEDVFATGADARTLAGAAPDVTVSTEFWRRLADVGAPVVAAASGWALGSGFELAVACDLLVASKTTRFGQPEVALGMIPGGGATQRLTRAIGRNRTMELILTARRMSAEQAHRYGLVNVVADRKRWMDAALGLAAQIAERGPIATRLAKRAILAAEEGEIERGMAIERDLLAEAMATEDRVEGVNAFLEGRAPRFESR
jgi:enoyl-CoA hydratase